MWSKERKVSVRQDSGLQNQRKFQRPWCLISLSFTAFPDVLPWEIHPSDWPGRQEPKAARVPSGKLRPTRLSFQRRECLLGWQEDGGDLHSFSESSTQTGDHVTAEFSAWGSCSIGRCRRLLHTDQPFIVSSEHGINFWFCIRSCYSRFMDWDHGLHQFSVYFSVYLCKLP